MSHLEDILLLGLEQNWGGESRHLHEEGKKPNTYLLSHSGLSGRTYNQNDFLNKGN